MDKAFANRMNFLPYPVLELSSKGRILRRNRLAKLLLPSVPRLRGMFSEDDLNGKKFLSEMRLDDTSYLVVRLQEDEGFVFLCFFENFLYLQEGISRILLGKMQDFFWELMNCERDPSSEKAVISARTAARICALQTGSSDYLRLLDHKEILTGEAKVCSLRGFFGHLKRALKVRGIVADFDFPDGANVFCEASVLSCLVLNLVHFAHLHKGDEGILLTVRDEGEKLRFAVNLDDEGGVTASLEALLRTEADERILDVLPLLCILRVCLECGIEWTAEQGEGGFAFSFVVKKGDSLPVLFLTDAAEAEVAELLQMVKAIFS